MGRTFNLYGNLVIFGIPILLLGILILLIKTPFYNGSNTLNFALTFDLLITVPIVYFLLIRKTDIPKTTVLPVMISGLLIGYYFLPKEGQTYLDLFKIWALPIIEIVIFFFVTIKVRAAIKKFKSHQGSTPDFYDTLKNTCEEIFPKKLVPLIATEVAVIYYGFINWKPYILKENEFTYHKNSGSPALFGAFIFIIGIESLAIHFLIAQWSIIIAWILTALSIYTLLQVVGYARSLAQRPVSIKENSLHLKYGIFNEVDIPFTDIEYFELSGKQLSKSKLIRTLSPLGEMESHNIIITLKQENEIVGIYGIKRKFKTIGFHIDEPVKFKEKLEMVLM